MRVAVRERHGERAFHVLIDGAATMLDMGDGSPLAHGPTLTATTPREDDARLAAGAPIGEYVIDRFLGAGATGEVYAGRHPVIGKRVAIKVLRPDLAASPEAAERFIREARAVNQIEHENVVDVFGFGRLEDGRLYLVMDLVEGKTLRAHLVDGPLELSVALAILEPIATALDAAHARGVVHRDLKPDNIVLTAATPPKVFVLDFGIAKLISTANANHAIDPATLTGRGTWLGTPGYMAPEQWSADGAGPASDRYALGVIAFELLAGAPPFSAASVPAMMEQHFRAEVPTLAARGAVGVPAALDPVLQRALAKDPDARFPSARAFVVALRDAAGSGARPAKRVDVPATRSHRPWWLALTGVGLLGAGVIVVLATRHDPAPPVAAPIDEPAPGEGFIEVVSSPPGAAIELAGERRGSTPARLTAKQGATIELAVAKPGYLAARRTLTVERENHVELRLAAVSQFVGRWRLANGELRELARNGDQVDVFKVSAVRGGPRTFFRHYEFVPAEHGVAFASDEEIVDPRAPNDPGCHVRVHVEYRYDPATDVLEQRRDKVTIALAHGNCVVQSRDVEPTFLTRVDGATDTVEIPAPVGKPIVSATKKPPRRKGKIIELDPTTKLQKKAASEPPLQNQAAPRKQVQAPPQVPQPQAQAPAGNAQDSAQPVLPRK